MAPRRALGSRQLYGVDHHQRGDRGARRYRAARVSSKASGDIEPAPGATTPDLSIGSGGLEQSRGDPVLDQQGAALGLDCVDNSPLPLLLFTRCPAPLREEPGPPPSRRRHAQRPAMPCPAMRFEARRRRRCQRPPTAPRASRALAESTSRQPSPEHASESNKSARPIQWPCCRGGSCGAARTSSAAGARRSHVHTSGS